MNPEVIGPLSLVVLSIVTPILIRRRLKDRSTTIVFLISNAINFGLWLGAAYLYSPGVFWEAVMWFPMTIGFFVLVGGVVSGLTLLLLERWAK